VLFVRFEDVCLHFDVTVERVMAFTGLQLRHDDHATTLLHDLSRAACDEPSRFVGAKLHRLSVVELDALVNSTAAEIEWLGYRNLTAWLQQRRRSMSNAHAVPFPSPSPYARRPPVAERVGWAPPQAGDVDKRDSAALPGQYWHLRPT
jgi:hypothetical protein